SWRGENDFAQPEVDRGHRKHLCRRNSLPRTDPPGDASFGSQRENSCETLPRRARHLEKSDRRQSRRGSYAKIMAAAASRKRPEMPALWTRTKINHDRRTDCLVLRTMPKACALMPRLFGVRQHVAAS